MTHKCDGCRFKGEHQEMMFRPVGVCLKESNLAKAEAAYNAKVCPHKQTDQMTEAEIMKAFEICANENGMCSECAYSDDYTNCNTRIAKDALDLINRKNAEIKKLREKCSKCGEKTTKTILHLQEILAEKNDEIKQKDDEIDYWKNNAFSECMSRGELEKATRAEAIKEVFSKLAGTTWYHINTKGELVVGANGETDIPLYKAEDIDQIAKEMGVEL